MIQILKEQPGASHTEMRKKLNIDTLNNHNNTLKKNYLKESLKNNQLIKDLLNEHNQHKEVHKIQDTKYSMFKIAS